MLDDAEAAGLVHTSNNSADKANLICNCCPCCCTVLRGKTQLKHPHAFEGAVLHMKVTKNIEPYRTFRRYVSEYLKKGNSQSINANSTNEFR